MSKSAASREAFEAWLDTKARLWCIDGHSADLMREAAQWSRSQALEEALDNWEQLDDGDFAAWILKETGHELKEQK